MVTNKEVIERVPDEIDYDCFGRRHPDGHDAPNAAPNAVTSLTTYKVSSVRTKTLQRLKSRVITTACPESQAEPSNRFLNLKLAF